MACAGPSIQGPRGLLPDALQVIACRILHRLDLLPEFDRWLRLKFAFDLEKGRSSHPVRYLWECLRLGSPLLTLVDLLGTSSATYYRPPEVSPYRVVQDSIWEASAQERYTTEFQIRVQVLEIQGRLPNGDNFVVADFLAGSSREFMKVLRTVERVLRCLETTYPGLYELPPGFEAAREEVTNLFISEEREVLRLFSVMLDSDLSILSTSPKDSITIECTAGHLQRIMFYQSHVVGNLETSHENLDWERIFSFDDDSMFLAGTGAYRSYCTDYSRLLDFLIKLSVKPDLENGGVPVHLQIMTLLGLCDIPIKHFLAYPTALSEILALTHPSENPLAFNALCLVQARMHILSQKVTEAMQVTRTTHAVDGIIRRAFFWNGPDPGTLGEFIFDDRVHIGLATVDSQDTMCYAFLFEQMLLLCRAPEVVHEDDRGFIHPATSHIPETYPYPIEMWNVGPAFRDNASISVRQAIPILCIKRVYNPEPGQLSFDIIWVEDDITSAVTVRCCRLEQYDQWMTSLTQLISDDAVSVNIEDSAIHIPDMDGLFTLDDLYISRRTSKPKPWSLIARRNGSTTSLTRSMCSSGDVPMFSPLVLTDLQDEFPKPPKSPLSIHIPSEIQRRESSTSETALSSLSSTSTEDSKADAVDLSGRITKCERYPAAHGGFADVWRCTCEIQGVIVKVAVKVLRGRLSDGEREKRMKKRLRRELRVWQMLDHENIIPLFGTCLDFGPYLSMVCPWYENGSLRHYIDVQENELHLSQRLKLLSDVASGLLYLHSHSIVHGDLSSSNVLINDKQRACLCDFGLSNVMEEFLDVSFASSIVGGAVRWAAPELYRFPDCTGEQPHASTASDIYSYGSVVLEVLSGKIPYEYLRSEGQVLLELSKNVRPRRPSADFVTDTMWKFITDCWRDPPSTRPASGEVSSLVRTLHQRSLTRHSM